MLEEKTLKAGAIILSSTHKEKIALIYRSKQDDWSFPKGHIDLGENATQTMIREIKEETGLVVDIIKEMPDLEYTHNNGQAVSIKMFLVSSKDDTMLKPEFESDSIKWVHYDEVAERLSYDNLKKYFFSILPIILSCINSK